MQFSINKSNNQDRNYLILFLNKWSLREIRDAGTAWWSITGRKLYLNYCVYGKNNTHEDYNNLANIFSSVIFNLTFSVVCSKDESIKDSGYRDTADIMKFSRGIKVRSFYK